MSGLVLPVPGAPRRDVLLNRRIAARPAAERGHAPRGRRWRRPLTEYRKVLTARACGGRRLESMTGGRRGRVLGPTIRRVRVPNSRVRRRPARLRTRRARVAGPGGGQRWCVPVLDATPSDHGESVFDFLNRVAGEYWVHPRQLMQAWADRIPDRPDWAGPARSAGMCWSTSSARSGTVRPYASPGPPRRVIR
jgi:hypothetical protein